MTKLDGLLAETFRAARWAKEGGSPRCPRCFDGKDLVPALKAQQLRANPGLQAYYCKASQYTFTDLWGTSLEHTKAPLLVWAYVILRGADTPAYLLAQEAGQKGADWHSLVAKARHPSSILDRWHRLLLTVGITPERLAAALKRRHT